MIEVAAGVLTGAQGRVLLAQRLSGTHLAGMWEFPGGKLEAGEGIEQALARELREELGIEARIFAPLISLPWRYPEKPIRLHALRVVDWRGTPHAREGHPLRWMSLDAIDPDTMPPADRPIVAALRLPPFHVITPFDFDRNDVGALLRRLRGFDNTLVGPGKNDAPLLQLRLPGMQRDNVRRIARGLLDAVPSLQRRLLLNADIELARELDLGVHLRAAQLRELDVRPLPHRFWVGASCHDADELEHAARIGADFAVLGAVRATASHSDAKTLGWEHFARHVTDARLPVYALGGVGPDDLDTARAAGAQGVAGIRAFSAVV